MTTFKKLGLNSDIMKGLEDLGFDEPTPIQDKAIPFILKSRNDLIALAQTGTGKTAAFGLPILNKIKVNEKELLAIILCPTRELCIQISRDITKYAKYSKGMAITAVYGGARIDLQIRSLRNGTNIVVGTPGRVHDLIRRKVLKLKDIKWLVLDEADEMLDMGFKDDLDAILKQTPKTRQTLLFSATISKSVNSIAKQYMKEAQEISIGEKNVGAEMVSHEYYLVQAKDRFAALRRILDFLPGVYGILFCRTRIETQKVADMLKQADYDAEALHGDISQSLRTKIMDRFKQKQVKLLVATDVAARGIDVSDLSHVINYNLPDHDEGYTHRSGRTGRAQKSGISVSILTPREVGRVRRLEEIIGKKFAYKKVPKGSDICKKLIDNFLKEIEGTDIKEINNLQFLQESTERLKKINKEDLIKLFLSNKFKRLTEDYKDTRDLNAAPKVMATRAKRGDNNGVNLKINFGKKHGFDVKKLFALINSNKKLKGVEIGKINLMLEYSIFSVEKRRAEAVESYLKGINFRGRKIDISKSNENVGYQGKKSYQGKRRNGRSGGFKGGFKGKRRGRKRY